jgi:hypothetical protein
MDEVDDFCTRVLGLGAAASEAAEEARGSAGAERLELLAAAARACRARAAAVVAPVPDAGDGLAAAVARELALASSRLPERQREVLALREALGLSHAQIASIMGIESAAVAPLLARARLGLRAERRGMPNVGASGECADRDRAQRLLALRQDAEQISAAEDAWLLEHLGECESCGREHAAMLEASACYRAWRLEPGRHADDVASAGTRPIR